MNGLRADPDLMFQRDIADNRSSILNSLSGQLESGAAAMSIGSRTDLFAQSRRL